MNELLEYIKGPFKPSVRYNETGDFTEVWWENKDAYAYQFSKDVTLMQDMETGRIVGVKLYGVKP